MTDNAPAQQSERSPVANASPVQSVRPRLLLAIIAVVGIVAAMIAIWGQPLSSIAASVIVVALLAFAQGQPVCQALPAALGHISNMRNRITNAEILSGSAPGGAVSTGWSRNTLGTVTKDTEPDEDCDQSCNVDRLPHADR